MAATSSAPSSVIKSRRIPQLNIAEYRTNRDAFIEALRHACHTVGFFMVRHEFGPLARRMMDESRSFFDRPMEYKLRVSYEDSPSFRGYMRLGLENTAGQMDYREQVEYAVEYHRRNDQGNDDDGRPHPRKSWPVYERLKGTNPWPDSFQPTLRPTTLEYASKVCEVADILRDALCLALQLDPAVLRAKFAAVADDDDNDTDEVPHWVIKLISYPPPVSLRSSGDSPAETGSTPTIHHQQGVGAHTDTNFLTLVLQDSVGGLQAYSQGEWIDVPSTMSAETISGDDNDNRDDSCCDILICNLGEQAETWSRGYFLATPHRVIMRAPAAAEHQDHRCTTTQRPRTSIPLFYNPCLSASMGPLDEEGLRVPWQHPRGYQHWRQKDNTMIPSVGENTFKSLARSHPEVFAKHHPDLQILPGGRIVRIVDTDVPS
jgi:isopenicillin N synthase-like dioxygenase